MYTIKAYSKDDYSMLQEWYTKHSQFCPKEEDISPTTFIISEQGTPLASMSLYLTNCKSIGWLESLVGNPSKSKQRKEAVAKLVDFIELYAKEMGIKRLFGFTEEDSLAERYKTLGYTKSLNKFSMVSKEL